MPVGERRARRPAGHYEAAFRVLGRYMDDQKPRDVFFFEQDGAFVLRLLMSGQAGARHELAEFTREDIDEMVARGPALRHAEPAPKTEPAKQRRAGSQDLIAIDQPSIEPGGTP